MSSTTTARILLCIACTRTIISSSSDDEYETVIRATSGLLAGIAVHFMAAPTLSLGGDGKDRLGRRHRTDDSKITTIFTLLSLYAFFDILIARHVLWGVFPYLGWSISSVLQSSQGELGDRCHRTAISDERLTFHWHTAEWTAWDSDSEYTLARKTVQSGTSSSTVKAPSTLSVEEILNPPLDDMDDDFGAAHLLTYEPSEISSFTTVRLSVLESNTRAIDQRAEEHRKKSLEAKRIASSLGEKRRLALSNGRLDEAFRIESVMRKCEKKAAREDEKAAELIFQARNRPGTSRIDVHLLRREEALNAVKKALREVQLKGGHQLHIIVGQGIHSVNGKPVLKPFLKSELKAQGMRVYESDNPGMLVVNMN